MIYYLTKHEHRASMHGFVRNWGRPVRHIIESVSYEDLWERKTIPVGTWIFTDQDRLSPGELGLAQSVWDQLKGDGRSRLLNEPMRYVQREDLLRDLAGRGLNDFRVHRIGDPLGGVRYPAFVRQAREHWGAIGGLCDNAGALRQAIVHALRLGHRPKSLIVVEFVDVRDEFGLYPKLSYFRIGDRVIPRHAFFETDWAVKFQLACTPDSAERELVFLRERPHARWARSMFELARVEYGRLDFSTKDGRPQLFEVNTNPHVGRPRSRLGPERIAAHELVMPWIRGALRAVNIKTTGEIPIELDRMLIRDAQHEAAARPAGRLIRLSARASRVLGPLRPVVLPLAQRVVLGLAGRSKET